VIYATSALLHMQFAATGWFFRYEAYLVALGLFTLADTSAQDVQQARSAMGGHPKRAAAKLVAVLGLSALAISPLLERGVVSLRQVTKATRNIYEQHYQMGMFLKTFYSGAVVAANDIGAITFPTLATADSRTRRAKSLAAPSVTYLDPGRQSESRRTERCPSPRRRAARSLGRSVEFPNAVESGRFRGTLDHLLAASGRARALGLA